METRQALLGRRSVRKYRTDPIPREELEAVLEAGLYAPSAVNMQHWYFVVVESPERMEELKEIMGRVSDSFRPVLAQRFPNHPKTAAETETFLNTLGHAPVCVLAFLLKNGYPDRDGAMQSVSAAIENLLIAAWDRGIGSCWISAPQRMGFDRDLREHFAPDKGEFVAAVTLGYPQSVPKAPKRREGRYTIV